MTMDMKGRGSARADVDHSVQVAAARDQGKLRAASGELSPETIARQIINLITFTCKSWRLRSTMMRFVSLRV